MMHKRLIWELKTRFKFHLRKGRLMVRCGIFGLELYWGAVVPLWDNVSIDEKRGGVVIYPMFFLVPGASLKCLKLLKTEIIDAVEGEDDNISRS